MTWQINKKLNAIHIMKGEPPCPKWEWQKGRRDWDSATNADFLNKCVTTLTWYRPEGLSKQEQEANARLISAAPEMLEALKLLFQAWDCAWIDPEERVDIYNRVDSAITKAEGGE